LSTTRLRIRNSRLNRLRFRKTRSKIKKYRNLRYDEIHAIDYDGIVIISYAYEKEIIKQL